MCHIVAGSSENGQHSSVNRGRLNLKVVSLFFFQAHEFYVRFFGCGFFFKMFAVGVSDYFLGDLKVEFGGWGMLNQPMIRKTFYLKF